LENVGKKGLLQWIQWCFQDPVSDEALVASAGKIGKYAFLMFLYPCLKGGGLTQRKTHIQL